MPFLRGTQAQADRIVDAVKKIEKANQGGENNPLDLHRNPLLGNWTAISTSTISARSGRTLGSGTALLQSMPDNELVEGEEITVYNRYGTEIPSGYVCALSHHGKWFVEGADCQAFEE